MSVALIPAHAHACVTRRLLLSLCLFLGTLGARDLAADSVRPPSYALTRTSPAPRKAPPKTDRYWQNAQVEVYKTTMEILEQHRAEQRRGLHYRKFLRGNHRRKQIALTFDDGPHQGYTPRILAILRRYKAKATFFVVGEMARNAPELVRAEVAGGHTVANHTYHHVNLSKASERTIATEIQACGNVLHEITGKWPRLFRPPGGDYNRRVADVVAAMDYTMVLWTANPGDYANPGARVIASRTLRDLDNGGVVLLHDGVQQTIDVLPQLLEYLRTKGFTFLTVDQLMSNR